MHEFTYRFDRDFIRCAIRRDFLPRAVLVFAVVVALFAGVHFVIMRAQFSPLVLTIMVGGLGIIAARLVMAFRGSVERVHEIWSKQSPSGEIRYQLDDEGISIELDQADSRFAWSDLRRLWRYPDVWLLEVAPRASVFFPVQAASDAAQAFVVERCRGAGVRV